MSQAPTPRGPLGRLLDDAKGASELEWREVEAGSGIPLATIQAWTSGRTIEPPLRGVLHLAKFLGIPPEDVMSKALEGYVPPLKQAITSEAVDPVAGEARGIPGKKPARKPSRRSPRSLEAPRPSPSG